MTTNQWGWFYFVVGLLVIVALLVGDIVSLVQGGGRPDMAFVTGMLAHVFAVVTAFKGGHMILPHVNVVSDSKRAQLQETV